MDKKCNIMNNIIKEIEGYTNKELKKEYLQVSQTVKLCSSRYTLQILGLLEYELDKRNLTI